MKDPLNNDKDLKTWVMLIHARDAIWKARRRELSKHKISVNQSAIIFFIHYIYSQGGVATPAEISRWLIREPHSVSEILSRMEKDGLVKRIHDCERKNMVRLILTDKGLEIYYQVYHKLTKQGCIHKIMSCLSEENKRQLRSYLKILLNEALRELEIES